MVVTVHVGVAHRRPPKVDEWRRTVVEADTEQEARLIACLIACCTSVMPVAAHIVAVEM